MSDEPMDEQEWECHESCPVRILGEQSGERTNGGGMRAVDANAGTVYGGKIGKKEAGQPHMSYGDKGTAARYFTQLSPDSLFAELDEQEKME